MDIPKVNTSIHTADNSYVLPIRGNREVPPNRYSPERKVRYVIAHYVYDHRLSPKCKEFFTIMDSIKIPTRVDETFKDPKWVETMNIEMEALQKNNTWGIGDQPKGACRMQMGVHKEEVYMSLPSGYSDTGDAVNVCSLKKTLHGLKQSPLAWFGIITAAMKKFGYQQANTDPILFIKHGANKVTSLIIYVDDIIVTSDVTVEIEELQKHLASKNLGRLKYFVGVEVTRSKHSLFLSQRKYDLLADIGMLDCKPANTPIVENHKLGIYVD
ncbi:unnamed protein product [Prunus armeniaca]